MTGRTIKPELVFLIVAALLVLAGGAVFLLSRASTLTVAVAPVGGTEPALLRAFAEALRARDKDVRLKILPFDGVRESAQALAQGKADLAVVRPDIALPENGQTLAILREQAVLIGAPASSGLKALPDLAGRRLGFIAERISDRALIEALLTHEGLQPAADGAAVPEGGVVLVDVAERALAQAFAEKRIDAVVTVTTPSTPGARRIVGLVRRADPGNGVRLLGVQDAAALTELMPKLKVLTLPAGYFGGQPRIPEEDVTTVAATYRLMARADLARSVAASVTQHLFSLRAGLAETHPAANAIRAPDYDSTAEATSARLPIHPGAIDYFEREQKSLIERYETWIYLLAFLGGGIGSLLAWLRQRVFRLRRERIEEATERLLEIREQAPTRAPDALAALAAEIDALAAEIARFALGRHVEARTMSAATIAIDAARATVARLAGAVPTTPTAVHGPNPGDEAPRPRPEEYA